jgi:hypothetical protein
LVYRPEPLVRLKLSLSFTRQKYARFFVLNFTFGFCHFTFAFPQLTNLSHPPAPDLRKIAIEANNKNMKRTFFGLATMMFLITGMAQAQTQSPQDSTKTEQSAYRGKHGHNHHHLRVWPFHRHGKGKHDRGRGRGDQKGHEGQRGHHGHGRKHNKESK